MNHKSKIDRHALPTKYHIYNLDSKRFSDETPQTMLNMTLNSEFKNKTKLYSGLINKETKLKPMLSQSSEG